MGIQCEYCGEISDGEISVICKYCGLQSGKTEVELLKNIENILRETQKKTKKDAQIQTRIAFASIIISIYAYLIALAALLVYVLTQPSIEERYVGLGIVVIILIMIFVIFKKYNIIPIDLDKIE